MLRTPRLLRSLLVVPGVAALALAACSPSDTADTTVELPPPPSRRRPPSLRPGPPR